MSAQDAARAAVSDFLRARRDRISPADAGLPNLSHRRRVAGLRREEVALLAGISPEYYVRLERGRASGVSSGVIDAVARALSLSEVEHTHLGRLLSALAPEARKRRPAVSRHDTVGPNVQVLLDGIEHLPALVFNARLDIIAANHLGRALYSPYFAADGRAVNTVRFLFLDEERARRLWPQWSTIADDVVAILRIEAGRSPDDPALIDLIGELSTRSVQFRTRWAANNVRSHVSGVKVMRHPLLGEISLPYENLHLDSATSQVLTVFTPHPGTPEHDAVQLLASWNAHTLSI